MPETTCNILGTLKSSGDALLNGKLSVQLLAPRVLDSTTPDTIQTTVAREYTISSGVVDIDLPETETVEIPYRFRLYLSDGDGGYLSTPLLDFNAIVPDTASVQFGSLMPTGITPDRLSTGALRVAKLILTDPTLYPYVVSTIGINRSLTPPTPTANNDVWVKNDDGTVWTWNAVELAWLSSPVTVTTEVLQMTTDTEVLVAIPTYFGKTTAFIYRIDFRVKVAAPNTGSNYWIYQSGYQLASNSSLDLILTPRNTSTTTAGTLVNTNSTPGTELELTGSSAVEYLGLKLTKQGSPGPINASVSFQLRYAY